MSKPVTQNDKTDYEKAITDVELRMVTSLQIINATAEINPEHRVHHQEYERMRNIKKALESLHTENAALRDDNKKKKAYIDALRKNAKVVHKKLKRKR